MNWCALLILLYDLILESLMSRICSTVSTHHIIVELILTHLIIEALILHFHHIWSSFATNPIHFGLLIVLTDVAGLELFVLTEHHLLRLQVVS